MKRLKGYQTNTKTDNINAEKTLTITAIVPVPNPGPTYKRLIKPIIYSSKILIFQILLQ